MDTQEGGGVNCASKIKCSNKITHELYWFGLPDLRPVPQPPRSSSTKPQVLNRVHLKTLQPQVFTGLLATLQQVFTQAHL